MAGLNGAMRRSIDDYPFDPADYPDHYEEDELTPISWGVAISDDYDDAEPAGRAHRRGGRPGRLRAGRAPQRRRWRAGCGWRIRDALVEVGQDPGALTASGAARSAGRADAGRAGGLAPVRRWRGRASTERVGRTIGASATSGPARGRAGRRRMAGHLGRPGFEDERPACPWPRRPRPRGRAGDRTRPGSARPGRRGCPRHSLGSAVMGDGHDDQVEAERRPPGRRWWGRRRRRRGSGPRSVDTGANRPGHRGGRLDRGGQVGHLDVVAPEHHPAGVAGAVGHDPGRARSGHRRPAPTRPGPGRRWRSVGTRPAGTRPASGHAPAGRAGPQQGRAQQPRAPAGATTTTVASRARPADRRSSAWRSGPSVGPTSSAPSSDSGRR